MKRKVVLAIVLCLAAALSLGAASALAAVAPTFWTDGEKSVMVAQGDSAVFHYVVVQPTAPPLSCWLEIYAATGKPVSQPQPLMTVPLGLVQPYGAWHKPANAQYPFSTPPIAMNLPPGSYEWKIRPYFYQGTQATMFASHLTVRPPAPH